MTIKNGRVTSGEGAGIRNQGAQMIIEDIVITTGKPSEGSGTVNVESGVPEHAINGLLVFLLLSKLVPRLWFAMPAALIF